ncbi:MAG: OHCU decarboxylase, partial [Nocardiopsaceae bacterium]|nr:OHCU decarboxylase [Nocardiopsaceae bacterium]
MSFNTVPAAELRVRLRACCAAGAWIEAITVGRPYPDPEALARASDAATAALDDTGLAQALAGHPRIGERPASGGVSGRRDSGRVSSGAPDRASGPVSRGAAWSRRE